MGAKDIERPSENSFPLLEQMTAAGKPVFLHVYPDSAHASAGPARYARIHACRNPLTPARPVPSPRCAPYPGARC